MPARKELLCKLPIVHATQRRHGDEDELCARRIHEILAHLLNLCGILWQQEVAEIRHAARVVVRDCALEPVAALDAEGTVVLCNQQEDTVVHPRVSDAPAPKELIYV